MPLLSASSCLKKLDAEDCDIQSLPDNLFNHKLEEINLKGNKGEFDDNKAGYTATPVACGWAGAVLENVTRASGQELYAQKAQKR